MNDLNTLVEKYPLLFNVEPNTPFSGYGFECDNGWYNILDFALNLLYSEYDQADRYLKHVMASPQTPQTLENASQQFNTAKANLPTIAQIKEKWGSLRLYIDGGTDYHRGVVSMAEAMSCTICEHCGNSGTTHRRGWNKTLCDVHAAEKYGNVNTNKN